MDGRGLRCPGHGGDGGVRRARVGGGCAVFGVWGGDGVKVLGALGPVRLGPVITGV